MATKSNYYRYSRNLLGLNAQGFFSGAAALAGDADLLAFQTNGAEGEILVLDSTNTAKTIALTATDEFSIAQKVDGEIKRSTVQTFGNIEVIKTAYDAPVSQTWTVGSNGTTGSLGISLTGSHQEFVLSARDLTPGNQPFPVMEGRAVVAGSPVPTIYSIVSRIAGDMVSDGIFEESGDAFCTVEVISDVAGTVGTIAATYTAFAGSTQVTASADVSTEVLVGEVISLDGSLYKVVKVTVSGSTTIIDLDRPVQVTASLAQTSIHTGSVATFDAGDYGFKLISIVEPINFVVGVGEDLAAADIVEATAWKQGSGAPWQVALMEAETSVFAGATTINVEHKEDWGLPNKFVDPDGAINYDLWFLRYRKTEQSSAAPIEESMHYGYIIIAAQEGSAGATSLDTIFGT